MATALHITAVRLVIPTVLGLAISATAAASPTARAGRDFLAYPAETIVLDGTASEPASGVEWRWAQVGGPSVALRDGATAHPTFRVTEPGRYSFELVVRAEDGASEPDTVEVIVADPAAGDRARGGCATAGPAGALAWLPLLGLMLMVPRRRS